MKAGYSKDESAMYSLHDQGEGNVPPHDLALKDCVRSKVFPGYRRISIIFGLWEGIFSGF